MQPYTYLKDVLNPMKLTEAVTNGLVRKQVHPEFPELAIYNYTETCAWDRAWSHETLECRGLVVLDGMYVLARPFPKFFNHDEQQHDENLMRGPVEVTDKMDGSLGIGYYHNDMWRVATRGSFASEQARWATNWLYEVYLARHGMFGSRPGWTPLWEIIYPENRIVVNYHGYEGMVLLGWRHIASGQIKGPLDFHDNWAGERTEIMSGSNLFEAVSLPSRDNAEGVVIRWVDTGLQLKVKQDDYKRMHAVVTNSTNRSIWAALAADIPFDLMGLPDEFQSWVLRTKNALEDQHQALVDAVISQYAMVLATLPVDFDRKTFAMKVKQHPYAAAIFQLHDGKSIHAWAWKQLKPEIIERPFAEKVST